MYESYLALGGVEIANVDRLVGYAKSVGCSVSWLKANGCGTLRHALGDELPYTHETIDQAPWYDQSQPDLSSRFLGIMVIDQKGLSDSSRQASLTEGIVDGGTIGGQRRASREARFRVLVVAEGSDALDYGIAWLSSALDADKCGQHGGRCGVTDLEFFTTCPEEVPAISAGDTIITDTPEHIVEDLRDQDTDLEPIVNHAPPIEGSGNWAPVYENLFTNPRLKGDGTWAEVRRNLAKVPIASNWNMVFGTGSSGTVETIDIGGTPTRRVEWDSAPTGGTTRMIMNPGPRERRSDVQEEVTYEVSALAAYTGPTVNLVVDWFDSSNTYIRSSTSVEDSVSSDPENPTRITWNVESPSGAVEAAWFIYPRNPEAGDVFWASSLYVGSPGTYFDGDSLDFSIDPDMRQRWLGTPNASESVMEIERVAGLTSTNCVAGVSTKAGKPAVRLIPSSASNDSMAILILPAGPPTEGVALGTLHLDAPLEEPLVSPGALSIYVAPPDQLASAPNAPGVYPLRLSFSELPPYGACAFVHGGAQGSGDVWWTDIGLFAGDYPYEAFNGESDPAEIGIAQPEDFRIRWTGTPDASTSVMEIETVAGLTGSNAIVGVSTRDGKPAVRIIPTGSEISAAFAFIPVTASSVTGMGTVSLDAPLQGTLYDPALTLEAGGVGVAAPNLAGDHPLRAMDGEIAGGYTPILLTNGATRGNGDVWWYDLGLFEDEYSGPVFNAETGWFQVDGNWYYATEGAGGLTTAYPGRAVFTYPTDNIKRFMHDVATVSGPLLIEELPTASGRYKGAILEFTIASERGYIYTVPRELNLAAAELSAAADEDINLAKNPSFELALTSRVAAGYNLATNPSVETNTNNWSTSFGAASRSSLVSAYGSYSYMVELTGSSSILGPDATYTQTNMGVPGQPLAGKVRKLAVGMWGALSVSAGAAQPTQMRFTAIVNGDPIQLETVEDESQFGGYYFMHDLELPSDWDGNLSLLLTSQFSNSGTSTVRLFGDGVFIGLGGA